MPKDVVLILTQRADVSADHVISALSNHDVEVVRFDTGDFPLFATLTASTPTPAGRWNGSIVSAERDLDLARVISVWHRRPETFRFRSDMNEQESGFATREARAAFGGILRANGTLWVNSPEAASAAEYKPYQLAAARSCGFDIPETLITNSPAQALRFVETAGAPVIYKPLSRPLVVDEMERKFSLYTTVVDDEILERIDRVKHTACLFQTRIQKKVELRVTVIGREVFAVAIRTPVDSVAAVDWRRKYDELTYEAVTIPPEVSEKILTLMGMLRLEYGAVDLIQTPDDEFFFLEVNQTGQYTWLEAETGLPMTDALAMLLARGKPSVVKTGKAA